MQWSSSNLLKQQVVKEAVATCNILTDTTPLVKPHAFDDHEADALRRTRQLEQARHQQQMEQLKEEMINEARNQADQIREEAQSAGFEAGKTAGFQQGYNEGLASGKAAAEDLLNQAQAMIKAATAQVNLFRQDKQQELIRYGIGIAESLIDQRFADDEEAYVPFVESVLRQFEQPDIFVTVRCAPTHAEALRTLLDSKKESITHFRYLLLPDEQLAAHDFTIESDHALVVFELQNEIDRFLQKLLEIGDQHG